MGDSVERAPALYIPTRRFTHVTDALCRRSTNEETLHSHTRGYIGRTVPGTEVPTQSPHFASSPPPPLTNSPSQLLYINMSGRGKGGKGLGKGGAKRHRKILRDNIQGEWARDSVQETDSVALQVSRSPLSVVLPAEVVSSVSLASSTRRPVVFSRSSSRT